MSFITSAFAGKSDHLLDSFVAGDTKFEVTSCYINKEQAGWVANIIESMPSQVVHSHGSGKLKHSDELLFLQEVLLSLKVSKSTTRKRRSRASTKPIRHVAINSSQSRTILFIEYAAKETLDIAVNALRMNEK